MHRLFWPLTDLDDLTTGGDLSQRLAHWAEDWLPMTGDVVHKIVALGTESGDDELLVFCVGGRFWAAIRFCSAFRNDLLTALPATRHSAGDDERQLLARVAEEMLSDLQREVFSLSAPTGISLGAPDTMQPDQLARFSFEASPGEYVRIWCSAEFLLAEPVASVAAIGEELKTNCLKSESAELTATVHIPTTMEALLNLTSGDVLPLAPLDDSPLTLRVSGQAVCSAYLGSAGDHKALLLVDQPHG